MTIHPSPRDRDTFYGYTQVLGAEKKGGVGNGKATNHLYKMGPSHPRGPFGVLCYLGSRDSFRQRGLEGKGFSTGSSVVFASGSTWVLSKECGDALT